jgi:hypothetical protein
MSGGLTTYPRTDGNGGGGSHLSAIRQAIAILEAGSVQSNTATAQLIIDSLLAYAANLINPPTSEEIFALAIAARNALFAARSRKKLSDNKHLLIAMSTCAAAWKAKYSLHSTSLRVRSITATQDLMTAKTALTTASTKADQDHQRNNVRKAMEEIGMIGWLYETSAVLGEDLGSTLAANAQKFADDPRFTGGYDKQNSLSYLECGGAYNVNVVLSIPIPGSAEKMLIVGEAKGGDSGYGTVAGPLVLLRSWGLGRGSVISQIDIKYAVSRAVYMRETRKTTASQSARKEAGHLIFDAFIKDQMLYLTARTDANQDSTREHFKCQE